MTVKENIYSPRGYIKPNDMKRGFYFHINQFKTLLWM